MQPDIVVVGAGAIGLSTALHLARAGANVQVLEKEASPGLHQSARNSGVIHAGYNVKPGSAKAHFCIEGARRLRAFCEEHAVAVRPGGILVLARTEKEEETLRELQRRANGNGVPVRMLDGAGIADLEPHAVGLAALHAPTAASVDAAGYVTALAHEARQAGAQVRYGVQVHGIGDASGKAAIHTDHGTILAGRVVNAAGLYADRLAGTMTPDMRIVPFRGFYAELRPTGAPLVRSHIYGAPDLAFPFLGVHLSRRTDGRVIVGPGAMLAFGRETYTLLEWKARELGWTLGYGGFWRMMARPEFRRLIRSEVAKSLRLRSIWREARLLVPGLRPSDLVRSYAGNRAQMVDRQGRLVEDIVVRTTPTAVHVLNAVSPGLTCSLPFGQHLARLALQPEAQDGTVQAG